MRINFITSKQTKSIPSSTSPLVGKEEEKRREDQKREQRKQASMRWAFGGNGGGGGGGGMLRAAQRTVRTGVGGGAQESFSHSTANANAAAGTDSSTPATTTRPIYKSNSSNLVSLSSSSTGSLSPPLSSFNPPRSPIWAGCSSPTYSDEFDNWECVNGSEDERERESANAFYYDFVFGSVPSNGEVQHAVSALQQVLDPASVSQFVKDRFIYNTDKDATDEISRPKGLLKKVSSAGKELDWIEPSLQLCNPRMLQFHESDRVYDAFHQLQTDPSIQRMVISLSSDKAVWDAVLNNEVVQQIRESMSEADNSAPKNLDNSDGPPNAAMNVLSWIFDNTKAKVMELIEKITMLVSQLFRAPGDEKQTGVADPFEEKLRTSFLLSVVVLLIVFVSRAHKA